EIDWAYTLNAAAGEDIRLLHCETWEATPFGTRPPDFYLLDNRTVAVMEYDDVGHWLGGEVISDPGEVARYRLLRDQSLSAAVHLSDYLSTLRRTPLPPPLTGGAAENEGGEPSPQPRRLSLRGRSLAGLQQEVASRERAARTIRSYSPTGIPGLLQTRAYIEALFAAGHLAVPLTEEGIMARLARQGILHDESKHFEFVLYEGALRWDFAPDTPGAHLAQLERIRLTAAFPNVEIGILPVGFRGSVWWRHPIDLLEDLAAGEPYAEAETLTAVVTVTDPADIERIRRILASLRERALVGEDAVALILRIEEELRS
ncbi:MAG TPA: DUF5753 domain-containing protein, partial [Candidatus Dormibacteraeota bacterium]